MPEINPISRKELISKLKTFGFDGPFRATKHQYMIKGKHKIYNLPDRADGFGFPAFLWGLPALPAQPAQPAQPVQLNACSQKFDAYLTGMKSLLPLFHRG